MSGLDSLTDKELIKRLQADDEIMLSDGRVVSTKGSRGISKKKAKSFLLKVNKALADSEKDKKGEKKKNKKKKKKKKT